MVCTCMDIGIFIYLIKFNVSNLKIMKNAAADWYLPLKSKYPLVSDEEWLLLNKFGKFKTIKKGHNFLSSGDIARYSAFVISGHFAYTIVDDEGNEKIIKFGLINDFLANCESFYHKTPSVMSITALEDSVVCRINIKQMQPLYNIHMCIADVNLAIYQEAAQQTFEHQYMLSFKSPLKRYKFLMEKRPEIIRKISIKNIAKYLYVSREAISRARLSLKNNEGLL